MVWLQSLKVLNTIRPMNEPRKIVLILGNGFDLDLGLKTSYKDFWESEFCPKDYPAPLIHHLNERWPDSLEKVKWYDLENELLNYYKRTQDPNTPNDFITNEELEFLTEFEPYRIAYGYYQDKLNLIESLYDKGVIRDSKNFLCPYDVPFKEDILKTPVWRDRKAFKMIKEGLCKYLKSISGQPFVSNSVALNVLLAANTAREDGDFLNIYTFNYTPFLVDYGNGFQNVVHYVHGDCAKGRIIIGTGDSGDYDKNYDFLQKSFDPTFNPPPLVADLLEADDVIVFGHSIGVNDRQYFKAFFKRQTDYSQTHRKEITIFTLDEDSEVEIKRSLQRMTDNNLSSLYGLNHVEIIKTARIKEDPSQLRAFLSRYISDEIHVKLIINQLLSSES